MKRPSCRARRIFGAIPPPTNTPRRWPRPGAPDCPPPLRRRPTNIQQRFHAELASTRASRAPPKCAPGPDRPADVFARPTHTPSTVGELIRGSPAPGGRSRPARRRRGRGTSRSMRTNSAPSPIRARGEIGVPALGRHGPQPAVDPVQERLSEPRPGGDHRRVAIGPGRPPGGRLSSAARAPHAAGHRFEVVEQLHVRRAQTRGDVGGRCPTRCS